MTVVSRRAVWTAGAAIAVLALVGAYQGWRRGTTEVDVATSTEGLLPVTNAVAAKQASALAEPPPPVLTEAQIRTIARQEAQAAISRPASDEPAPTPAPSPAPAPALNRPAPPADRLAPMPVPTPQPTPAPEPNNVPLY
jgi:hypothetical protein